MPFFAWECITLQIKDRPDLYLVIRNEKNMSQLIKLLIYELKTINGERNSSLKIYGSLLR